MKPISPAPVSAACSGGRHAQYSARYFQSSRWRRRRQIRLAIVSDISDRLSSEKPNRYMPSASVPTSDSGTEEAPEIWQRLRRQIAQKDEDHQHDQCDGEAEFELDIGNRSSDRPCLV